MKIKLREEINIRVKLYPDGPWMELSVEEGTTLEDVLRRFEEESNVDYLAAKTSRFEQKVISLKEKIVGEEDYEFLDMSEPSANQIYQRSLIFMYLKAVHDILGEDRVIISNSLNKGIYTEIRSTKPVSAYEVKRLYEYMRGMSAANLPFEQTILPAGEALEHLERQGSLETKKMFEKLRWSKIPMYSLDGYESFFYDFLAPSTGYIRYFELKKYRRGILLRFPHPDRPDVIPEYRDDKKLYQA
ncbi:MAG: hypothetical protein J6S45_04925, partial [Firmicutes bacterium]|nr:hypothetical protein [Bacillota bacterium]